VSPKSTKAGTNPTGLHAPDQKRGYKAPNWVV
jgi:hypothetical protein